MVQEKAAELGSPMHGAVSMLHCCCPAANAGIGFGRMLTASISFLAVVALLSP
jgi:hypothetical protein